MSRKVEEAVGGLVQSLFGGLGSQTSLFGGGAGTVGTQPSLGFLTFLEKLQEASNVSREDERQFLETCAEQWLSELKKPALSAGSMTAVMQRALVAACRGYIYPQLHIHAVKFTQAPKVAHKKMGYLYLSVCAEQSELSLLTTNTLHKDLQGRDTLSLVAALTALPSVLRSSLPPQLLHALCNCLHHPISLVRRRTCQVLYAGLTVWTRGGEDVRDRLSGGGSRTPVVGSHSDYGSYDGSHRSSYDEASKSSCTRHSESSKFPSATEEPPDNTTTFVQDLLMGEAVPALLQLLSDDDPSVAIAATQTLALLYQHSNGQLEFVRNSVACSAAHLLTEAFNAALPSGYDTHSARAQPINAPHVQLAMLKALRQLCSGPDWPVPAAVVAALTPVLTQVWGAGHPGVCMTLQEAVLLTLQLPRTSTSPGLRNTAVNTLLGFLKTSNSRLQLAAVTALAHNWTILRDCVTPALLHAVVHNLHTTTSTIITNTTLHLLYTMANERNYKSVVGTLVQYCGAAGPHILQTLLAKMARIISTSASDSLWCLQQLQALLLLHPHPALSKALGHIISTDLDRGCRELVSPVLSLLNDVLQQSPVPRPHLVMAAAILTSLEDASVGSKEPPLPLDESVTPPCNSLELVLPDSANSPFMSDDERKWLSTVNEKFVSKIIFTEFHTDDDQVIFECLKKIGLYDSALRGRVVAVALSLANSPDLVRRSQAREVLVWLRRRQLSLKVLEAEQQLRNSLQTLDWTLPFIEDYIIESLEKKNEMPYLPRSCSVHGDFKPSVVLSQRETRPLVPALTPRGLKSFSSTPRSGVSSEPRVSVDLFSVATSSSSSSNPHQLMCTTSALAVRSEQPQGIFTSTGRDITPNSSCTPGVVSSLGSLSLSISSSQPEHTSPFTASCSERSSLVHEGELKTDDHRYHRRTSSHLLWSVEGRSSQALCLSALEKQLPEGAGEDIEVGAEASEELLLPSADDPQQEGDNEVPSTAAALAKALYAGLGQK